MINIEEQRSIKCGLATFVAQDYLTGKAAQVATFDLFERDRLAALLALGHERVILVLVCRYLKCMSIPALGTPHTKKPITLFIARVIRRLCKQNEGLIAHAADLHLKRLFFLLLICFNCN